MEIKYLYRSAFQDYKDSLTQHGEDGTRLDKSMELLQQCSELLRNFKSKLPYRYILSLNPHSVSFYIRILFKDINFHTSIMFLNTKRCIDCCFGKDGR